ncbi:hypothetical protein QTP86_030714 [Hemibagrus guttatus]|nr:hypothetical protein QTP86_030714 [Hemibagrus guttatus]
MSRSLTFGAKKFNAQQPVLKFPSHHEARRETQKETRKEEEEEGGGRRKEEEEEGGGGGEGGGGEGGGGEGGGGEGEGGEGEGGGGAKATRIKWTRIDSSQTYGYGLGSRGASGVIGHQGRIHPGRSANPSQGTYTLSTDNLEMPINLQCMSLDGGRKPEYPEETPEAWGEHANSTHT